MVENYTPQKDETYSSELENVEKISDDLFEEKIIHSIKDLVIEPNQEVIESILNYSKTYSDK